MSKLGVVRLGPHGKFSVTEAEVEGKYAMDKGKRQAHTLSRDRVFVLVDPVPYDTLEELKTAAPPPLPYDYARRMIVVEDHAIIPLQPGPLPPPELAKIETEIADETTEQLAVLRAARDAKKDATMAQVFLLIAGTASLLGIILGIVVALNTFVG